MRCFGSKPASPLEELSFASMFYLRRGGVDAVQLSRDLLCNCESASFGNDGLVGHARDTQLDFCFGHSDSFQDSWWSRHVYDSLLVDQAMRV